MDFLWVLSVLWADSPQLSVSGPCWGYQGSCLDPENNLVGSKAANIGGEYSGSCKSQESEEALHWPVHMFCTCESSAVRSRLVHMNVSSIWDRVNKGGVGMPARG